MLCVAPEYLNWFKRGSDDVYIFYLLEARCSILSSKMIVVVHQLPTSTLSYEYEIHTWFFISTWGGKYWQTTFHVWALVSSYWCVVITEVIGLIYLKFLCHSQPLTHFPSSPPPSDLYVFFHNASLIKQGDPKHFLDHFLPPPPYTKSFNTLFSHIPLPYVALL